MEFINATCTSVYTRTNVCHASRNFDIPMYTRYVLFFFFFRNHFLSITRSPSKDLLSRFFYVCVCVFIYFRKNQSIHEFDRNEEHPLLGIEFGGGFVVKTRATLSYEVEPPLFPALTLSLFDPVPPACPPLIVVESPFPCGGWLRACLPTSQPASLLAFLPACVRECVHVAFHCLRNASSTGSRLPLFSSASSFLPFFLLCVSKGERELVRATVSARLPRRTN